eukprot:scaffold4736_cov434-Prasinococcus_capsulatus_cf.AAC.4
MSVSQVGAIILSVLTRKLRHEGGEEPMWNLRQARLVTNEGTVELASVASSRCFSLEFAFVDHDIQTSREQVESVDALLPAVYCTDRVNVIEPRTLASPTQEETGTTTSFHRLCWTVPTPCESAPGADAAVDGFSGTDREPRHVLDQRTIAPGWMKGWGHQ